MTTKITFKIKEEEKEKVLEKTLHILYNLNGALSKYREEFGSQRKWSMFGWNDKASDFLNTLKIKEDDSEETN